MEALVGSSSKATITLFSLPLQKNSGFSSLNNSSLKFQNGYSFFAPILSNKLQFRSSKKRPLMVEARKSDDKKKKNDSHSFAPKPDEATGPFPEAVLLKQKKVQKDGRVLPEFSDEEEEELFESLNLQLESDFNVDEMRHYEVVYLVHQDYKEKIEDVNSKIQDFIREKKGRVWRFSDWGMRRLAYKIKKTTHAHYILINFELGGQWINEFKQMLDQDERVIRHLVIKRDKAITEDCPPPPEFHTLRADMVDEYEVDDDVDDDDEDEEWYDDDDEEEEEDDADSEDASSKNVFEGTDNQKVEVTGKETLELEKALR